MKTQIVSILGIYAIVIAVVVVCGCQGTVNVNETTTANPLDTDGNGEVTEDELDTSSSDCSSYAIIGSWDTSVFNTNQNDTLTFADDCVVTRSACGSQWVIPDNLDASFSAFQDMTIVVSGSPEAGDCLTNGSHSCRIIRDYDPGLTTWRVVWSCDGGYQWAYFPQ